MIQICRKDKEKVYKAIRTGKIDAAEMSFPNLIDDIILFMKKQGLTDLLAQALTDKRRDNSHIPFDILLRLAVAVKLKCKVSLTDLPNLPINAFVVYDALFHKSCLTSLPAADGYHRCAGTVPEYPGCNGTSI